LPADVLDPFVTIPMMSAIAATARTPTAATSAP
jgi:hypothetical protein